MTLLRRHVRLWATAWLVLQAASLAAFVPRDCCAAHRPAVMPQSCHDAAPQAHCPMRSASGTPCPMHRAPAEMAHDGHGSHAGHDAPAPTRRSTGNCAIRGTCEGPTFFSVLSYPGLPPDPTPVSVRLGSRAPVIDLHQAPVARFRAPDPRPLGPSRSPSTI